ncbi:MAG: ATP-binding protein, partial [Chlorobiales bacterium]|nr:ATP-binding protein [Chlorobiales bacterium]
SALALAQKILSQETALRPGPTTEVRKRPELPGIGSFKRISRSEWVLRQEGFYTRLEVIEEKILHSVSRGSLKAVHIPEIDRLRERVRREMGLEEGFDYIVAEICGLQGTDRKTRLRYMRSILGWHRSWPLKGYFFYGSNRFMKTVISLAKPLMPFPVRTVGGLEEALEMITRRRPEKAGNRSPGPVKRPSLVCNWGYRKEAQVEEILSFLADIDWERENPVPEHRKEPSHPFFEVFEAISLINNELDELLRERDRSEEEKMRMEACLRRNEKLEAVGTLAGGIAHDFNNILAAIVGYAELARHELPEENRAREYLEQILVSSFRAKELVQQMLNFARRSARDRKPVVVSRLIEKAFEQLKPSLPPGIKIKLEHSFEEGVVLADQEQIQQVLVNVLDNGVRAMGNKDGVLEVGLERVRLNGKRLSGETELEPGHYLEIRVRDTGVGMKKEVIGRIFEPFFTTRETGQGRGMGLAVVHGIVKVHGGEVRVKSKPGQGSTFSIMLPLMGEDNRDNYGISIKENQINLTSSDLSKEF